MTSRMTRRWMLGAAAVLILVLGGAGPFEDVVPAVGEEARKDSAEDLRAGRGFIPTKVYSQEEDDRTLALFEGLRVADVADAMDQAGLQGIGLMDPAIRPLW